MLGGVQIVQRVRLADERYSDGGGGSGHTTARGWDGGACAGRRSVLGQRVGRMKGALGGGGGMVVVVKYSIWWEDEDL